MKEDETFPRHPSVGFFFNMILTIPLFPCASYLAGGIVITSTLEILSANFLNNSPNLLMID